MANTQLKLLVKMLCLVCDSSVIFVQLNVAYQLAANAVETFVFCSTFESIFYSLVFDGLATVVLGRCQNDGCICIFRSNTKHYQSTHFRCCEIDNSNVILVSD